MSTDQRALVDAILFVLDRQIAWGALPIRFPPKSTVHRYFVALRRSGRLEKLYHLLFEPRWRAADLDDLLITMLPERPSCKDFWR